MKVIDFAAEKKKRGKTETEKDWSELAHWLASNYSELEELIMDNSEEAKEVIKGCKPYWG